MVDVGQQTDNHDRLGVNQEELSAEEQHTHVTDSPHRTTISANFCVASGSIVTGGNAAFLSATPASTFDGGVAVAAPGPAFAASVLMSETKTASNWLASGGSAVAAAFRGAGCSRFVGGRSPRHVRDGGSAQDEDASDKELKHGDLDTRW